MTDFKPTVTLKEIADLVPIPYTTLHQAAQAGRIRAFRSGSIYLTTLEAVADALEEGRLWPFKPEEERANVLHRLRMLSDILSPQEGQEE